ncbi:hypothetical protein LTR66_003036 [Elasticomyces elasticus]|nr:hypothetical protein LTR66_003036 [Elasticomyces elasticus]
MEREGSRDRDMVLMHQHSFSDSGRISVPISDPDRAPPPLPLNPGSPTHTVRPNTSANIAAAANKLADKARESTLASSYTTNPMPQTSPERSLIKGTQPKRMQSLQPGGVRDLRSYLDGVRSPERSPERPSARGGTPTCGRENDRDYMSSSPQKGPEQATTPTPSGRDALKDTPTLRPTTRPPPRAILGENTPPSATMLALQTMAARDPDAPFGDITNSPIPRTNVPPTFDAVSSQILNLTTIATSLQREMAQLSRRSKDNATDLVSLKEATNCRDEDIRKSLRELVSNFNSSASGGGHLGPPGNMSRASSNFGVGPHFLDSKAYHSPPSASKPFTLPRISSHNSFVDADRGGSPSPYSVEGAASVAMLEKIIREMVTKEGQERLLSTLSELLDKSSKDSVDTAKKVEELVEFIRDKSESQALVTRGGVNGGSNGPPKLDLCFDQFSDLLAKPSADSNGDGSKVHTNEHLTSEVLRLLHKIKDSVTSSGGMSGELKALVRELRGEVLGMGREIGRKLDHAHNTHNSSREAGYENNKVDVAAIVQESISDLKEHMEQIVRENRRRSLSIDDTRDKVDGQEVYAVVKHALAERTLEQQQGPQEAPMDKESILAAVREAYEEYKPEIELQQFGLERDEILQVLKEGLEDYQTSRPPLGPAAASREDVVNAVNQAFQYFQPPQPALDFSTIKEELLAAVCNCLEEYKSAVPPLNIDGPPREYILEAVREGLANSSPSAPRELEISRDDLFDAVKTALDDSRTPFGTYGKQVLDQLHELVDGMRLEFKQYSAANGRDTEQVLDAVKDGLESLRSEIETYVDRAQDVTARDEIVETIRGGLEQLRGDVQGYCAQGPTGDNTLGRTEMLNYIKAEFEHLHETVGSQGIPSRSTETDKEEIIIALRRGMEELKTHIGRSGLDEDNNEEILEAMKEEFEQLKDAVLDGSAGHKIEILETIRDSLGSLHAQVGHRSIEPASNDNVLATMKDEFTHLRETLATILIKSGSPSDKDDIMDAVRETMDGLRAQLSDDQSEGFSEVLGAVRAELEQFRGSLRSGMVGSSGSLENKEEIIELLRVGLDDLHAAAQRAPQPALSEDLLEAIRGEFELIRQQVASSVTQDGPRADTEEVLDAVRLGLDDLRSHMEKKLDNPEQRISLSNELLDALNDGLDGLRTDLTKAIEKPIDMAVNYQILDTLKDGLTSIHADMDRLKSASNQNRPATPKGGAMVLIESLEGSPDQGVSRELPRDSRAVPKVDALKRDDLQKMEVLLAQLQIKVEAIDANIQDMPAPKVAPATPVPLAEGTVLKDDIVSMEEMLREIQAAVTVLAGREAVGLASAVRKEDTDAIETLLRNTKAKVEELVLPDPATTITKEHIDAVEAVVRMTHEAVEGLAAKNDGEAATKTDVAVVELLIQDMKTALHDIRLNMPAPPTREQEQNLATKIEVDVIGQLCIEIKNKVNGMAFPNAETLPSKADIEQLTGLIHDFRDSHDKMKDSYEADISVTAKAFDDRKQEAETVVDRIEEAKISLHEIKEELKAKIVDGSLGIAAIGKTVKRMEETMGGNTSVSADIKELVETVTREFERVHGCMEGVKVDQEQSATTIFEKHSEHRDAIVMDVTEKLDACFDGLMSKYDDAQNAAEEKARLMEEKAIQQEELLTGVKRMAEDLRLTIDVLGATATELGTTFNEATEKIGDDSKTVFNRVDDMSNKLDVNHTDVKVEHALTREEVAQTTGAVNGLQSDFTEFHPRVMITLEEVRALVTQHYEHSQKAQEMAREYARGAQEQVRSAQEEVRAATRASNDYAEQLKNHAEDIKNTFTTGFSSLPALMASPSTSLDPAEKYNDAAVHQKLDKLVNHASDASKASAQLERLDQIHQQVMATAAEVSAFVAVQTRQIAEDHKTKEKEAEEVALILERRLAQKDQVESDITSLNSEKETLYTAIEAMKSEQEAIAVQKARLAADLSSLNTAISIRREELHAMDAKADALERRILEGIMNQSRTMLVAKATKSQSTKPAGKELRRTPSNTSQLSTATITSSVRGILGSSQALALQSRPQPRRNGALPNTAQRRIMSLSQIDHNVPSGGAAFSATSPSVVSSGSALNRSHSVKSPYIRKVSWAGKRNLSMGGINKENEALSEESEDELDSAAHGDGDGEDLGSESGTERRASYSTATGTESRLTYSTRSYADGTTPSTDDGRRTSYGTSDLTYGTGSYITGSDVDRRTSYSSTIHSNLGTPVIDEEDGEASEEEEFEEAEGEQQSAGHYGDEKKQMSIYAPPSDSGLGTDLPSANPSGGEGEYFKRDE